MRTRIQLSTVREGKPERLWGLLRRRGMPAALLTSFSAKSGVDLLLVYVPLLGVVVGLTSSQVGILLGISSSGALLARAATPFFVRRIANLRLTVIATRCRSVVSARPRRQQRHRADDDRDVGARLRARPVADHHHGLGRQPGRRHQPGLGARPAGRNQPRRADVHPRGSGRGIGVCSGVEAAFVLLAVVMFGTAASGSPAPVAVLSPRAREQRLATSVLRRDRVDHQLTDARNTLRAKPTRRCGHRDGGGSPGEVAECDGHRAHVLLGLARVDRIARASCALRDLLQAVLPAW